MTEEQFPRKWYILAAVSASVIMGTLDASIINIALPTLGRIFSIDVNTVVWTVSSYLLVITSFLIVAGRLGDMYGRKRIFLTGLTVFTAGSFFCGISQGFSMLVISRILQAFGGAMVVGNSSAIVTDNFPARERGKALGFIGTVVSIGLTMGPPLGGIIIEYIGWRYIFFVNIPVGITAFVICFKMLPGGIQAPRETKLDITGILLLPLILLSLIIGINSIGKSDFLNPVLLIAAALFVVLSIFFYRHETGNTHPLIDFSLLLQKRFLFSSIAGFISYISLIFVIILLPFYNEEILGLSSAGSGKILLTLPLVSMFLAPLSGTISDRIGQRVLASAGLAVGALGIYSLLSLDQFGSPGQVAFRLLIIGTGFGFFVTPNNSAIMGSIPVEQRGLASGMLGTVRNLGMAIGVTISASLFTMCRNSYIDWGLSTENAFMAAFYKVTIISLLILITGVVISLLRGNERKIPSVYSTTAK